MTLNELFQRQPQRRKLRPPVSESDTEHYDTLLKTGYWGRQAAGCIFLAQDTGRFCIAHRSQAVLEPGTWGTWGGAIDSGEDPAEAVRREVAEEAGYTGPMKLIPLMVFQAPGGTFQYHNFLAVVPAEFDPRLDWETQDYRWVEWGEWPEPLHPGMRALLADGASTKTMQQYAQTVTEHFKQKAKPGSRPGSLKRKAGKKKGEKITASDLKRLQSRANRMKKSPNADTRKRGIQLARQVSWHRNFHK